MLHPQARALLQLMIDRGLPPVHTLPPGEARAQYLARRHTLQPEPPAMAQLREIGPAEGAPVPMRLYRPAGVSVTAAPALVYFHGGGWVIGDLDTHDTLCRELAQHGHCAVVSVDYRLAPEHRFPAAVDDCWGATRWVHAHAAALGLDDSRLAVGGDSAGGNLAAVVALLNREAGSPLSLQHQLLIYPATDMRRGHPSHTTNGQGYLLTQDSMRYYHDHYIDDAAHDLDWRASPLLHPDLSDLPPAFVMTAGFDPLRDEGADYARRLSEAGVRCTYLCFERQIHGFITMGRVLEEAHTAVAVCAAEVRRALNAPGSRPQNE